MDSIRINILPGDISGIDNTARKLETLGVISQENGKKFEESGKKHSQALHETGTEVDRIEGKMRNLAERIAATFAIERILEFAKESVLAFAEAEQGLKQLEFAVTKINGQGRETFIKLREQSEKLSKSLKNLYTPAQLVQAQKQLATFGLTGKQIEKLLPQVIDMASATGKELPEAIEKSILAINGQTKGLRDVGIAFKDTGSKTQNMALLQKDLAKFTGAANDMLDSEAGKLKTLGNYWEELKELIGEYLSASGQAIADTISLAFGTSETAITYATAKLKEVYKKDTDNWLEEAQKKTKVQREQMAIESDERQAFYAKELGKGGKQWRINKLKLDMEKEYYKNLKKIDEDENAKIQGGDATSKTAKEDKTKDHLKRLLDLYDKFNNELSQADIDGTKDESQKKIKELNLSFQKQKEELQKEEQELIELTHDKNKNVRIAAEEDLTLLHATSEAMQQAYDDKLFDLVVQEADKRSKAENDILVKQYAETKKKLLESNEVFNLEMEDDLKRQLLAKKITQEEYDKKDLQRQYDIIQVKKSQQEKGTKDYIALQVQEDDVLLAMQKKKDDKLKEQVQNTMDAIQQIGEFAFKISEDIINNNIDAIDHQEQLTKDSIQQQQELAIAGKANTLAFEKRNLAEEEKKREQEKKKLIKLKELEVFLNSVASFSKDDPKSAIGKALAILAVTKGAEATFAEDGGLLGQINNKSWQGRKHKGGGDILVHAQTGEGILSRNDISAMGGEQAFLNFKNMLGNGLPPIPMSGVMFQAMDTKKLEDKVDSLNETIRNKKETTFDFEGFKGMMAMYVTEKEKGITTQVKHELTRRTIKING